MNLLLRGRTFLFALVLGVCTACTTVADPLVELGDAEAAGDSGEVLRLTRSLLADPAALEAASPDATAELRRDLAEVLAREGRAAEAIAAYDQVLADHFATAPDDFATEIELRARLAELALESDDKSRATSEVAIAARLVRTHLGNLHPRLAPLLGFAIDAELDTARIAEESGLTADGVTVAEALDLSALQGERSTQVTTSGTRSLGEAPADDANFDLVKVFYGTSRAPKPPPRFFRRPPKQPSASNYYSAKRGTLSTGTVIVSVPRNRALGEIPKASAVRFEFRPDPAKHVILGDFAIHDDLNMFMSELNAELGRSSRKEAFVFIHGYNNDFPTAIERTAQLAIDLEIDGAPLLYSWPSAGSVFSYRADRRQIVDETISDLERFLTLVAKASDAEHVHVVAHSMGNEFLLKALQELAAGGVDAPLFEQIVFASPDVDADEFADALSDLPRMASNLTLYASSKDQALKASRRFNRSGRRAGESDEPLIIDGLATVDTTVASAGGLGHSDIFGPAFPDFQAVLWHSLMPEQRCLLSERSVDKGVAWVFGQPREEFCGQDEFTTAMTTLRRLGPGKTADALQTRAQSAEAENDPSASRWLAALQIIRQVQ